MRVSIIYIYIYFPSYIYINIYIYICSHTRRKNNILLYVPTDLLITSRSVSSLLFGFVKLRKSLLGFRIGTCFCDYLFIKNAIYIYKYIDQRSQDFLSRNKAKAKYMSCHKMIKVIIRGMHYFVLTLWIFFYGLINVRTFANLRKSKKSKVYFTYPKFKLWLKTKKSWLLLIFSICLHNQ